jgi:hypothetical protein
MGGGFKQKTHVDGKKFCVVGSISKVQSKSRRTEEVSRALKEYVPKISFLELSFS